MLVSISIVSSFSSDFSIISFSYWRSDNLRLFPPDDGIWVCKNKLHTKGTNCATRTFVFACTRKISRACNAFWELLPVCTMGMNVPWEVKTFEARFPTICSAPNDDNWYYNWHWIIYRKFKYSDKSQLDEDQYIDKSLQNKKMR